MGSNSSIFKSLPFQRINFHLVLENLYLILENLLGYAKGSIARYNLHEITG